MNNILREELQELIAEHAILTGEEYQLSAGGTSTTYFNVKAIMGNPEGLWTMAELISDVLPASTNYVAGMALGAVPLVCAVMITNIDHLNQMRGCWIRKEDRDHGTQAKIEGLSESDTLPGKDVVVLEDVTTTGKSVLEVVALLREQGAKVTTVITVIDRLSGAKEALEAAGLKLETIFTSDDFKSDS